MSNTSEPLIPLTAAEQAAFRAEHAELAKTATGEPQPMTCKMCGHWWLGWPQSTCPKRGRHSVAPRSSA